MNAAIIPYLIGFVVLVAIAVVLWSRLATPKPADRERLRALQNDWQPPEELRSHGTPRAVRLTTMGRTIFFLVAGIGIALVMAGLLLIPGMLREQRDNELIAREGVPGSATVTRRWSTSGKRTSYYVAYGYDVGGARFGGEAPVGRVMYDLSSPGLTIAIRYLPSRPEVSRVNDGTYSSPWAKLAIFVPAPFLLFVPWRIVQLKNLLSWGRPVGAIVIGSWRTKGGQAIRYQFLDSSGEIVNGSDTVGRNAAPQPGDVITVLFDPDRAIKTARYPMKMVELDGG